MLIFGHSGYPILLFPDAKGKYYQAKDEGLISSVSKLIDDGKIKIYCPDSVDDMSWYNWSIHPSDRVKTHIGYENVILNDVIEFIMYDSGNQKIAVAGCGLGGYHAANLAFRHPDRFSHIIMLGGIFDIKQFIFGHYDDNSYFHNPLDYLPNLEDKWYLDKIRQMGILLATGDDDINFNQSKQLSGILSLKDVNHWLDVKEEVGCGYNYWRKLFPEYISKMIY
ncbi:MAG: esterase [Ignavibacteriaceae bacterium]|nr:esterase [Ignavibacteriaceae bacterium]